MSKSGHVEAVESGMCATLATARGIRCYLASQADSSPLYLPCAKKRPVPPGLIPNENSKTGRYLQRTFLEERHQRTKDPLTAWPTGCYRLLSCKQPAPPASLGPVIAGLFLSFLLDLGILRIKYARTRGAFLQNPRRSPHRLSVVLR